jgi:hypothetical protein
MGLSKKHQELVKEAEAIARLAHIDFWNVQRELPRYRGVKLKLAINQMAVAAVIAEYTLLDEVLADLICRYYFKRKNHKRFILWRQKRFRVFVHYVLDELFLLKKMELANSITPLPKEIRSTVHRVNSIRNALAHSFFPENRREHMKLGKVLYKDLDLRSSAGLQALKDDCHTAFVYLARLAYGKWAE